jgi:DNA mismatch repair ATPase MutS
MQKFILTIRPVEIIFDIDFPSKDDIITPVQQYIKCLVSVFDVPVHPDDFISQVCNIQSISSFGKALEDGRLATTALLFNYLKHTQKKSLSNIVRISFHSNDKLVIIDDITIKNLEIFASSYENTEKYSLFGIIDNTKTV